MRACGPLQSSRCSLLSRHVHLAKVTIWGHLRTFFDNFFTPYNLEVYRRWKGRVSLPKILATVTDTQALRMWLWLSCALQCFAQVCHSTGGNEVALSVYISVCVLLCTQHLSQTVGNASVNNTRDRRTLHTYKGTAVLVRGSPHRNPES